MASSGGFIVGAIIGLIVGGGILGLIFGLSSSGGGSSSRGNGRGITIFDDNETDTQTNEEMRTDKEFPIDIPSTSIVSSMPNNTDNLTDILTDNLTEQQVSELNSTSIDNRIKESDLDIFYNVNELKIFNIETNISSTIIGEDKEENRNDSFYSVAILGIRDEKHDEIKNEIYYEGFFSILCKIYYNETTQENQLISANKELFQIIGDKIENNFIINEIKNYDSEEDDLEINPLLKALFYKDGSYKEIFIPKNLSDENYHECKELLEIILPKLSKDLFVEKINETTIEEKEAKQLDDNQNRLKNMNKANETDIKVLRFLRKMDEQNPEKNGIEVQDENSNETYYIDIQINEISGLEEDEEKRNTTILNQKELIEDNTTKIDTYKKSSIYSDDMKFEGSKMIKNISTLIDESTGFIKEIFARTFTNVSKQNYSQEADKEIYNENNYLSEVDLVYNDNQTDNENETNINFKYDIDNVTSIISNIYQHIVIYSSLNDKELIKEIYTKFVDKYEFEKNSPTTRILRRLRNLESLENEHKYEINKIKKRYLEEEEEDNTKFYGLRTISHRKDIFQTNFLGVDIALGLVNSYYPNIGQSFVYFKMNFGKYEYSQKLKSFRTNEKIITENLQQMSFQLLKYMKLTQINLESKNAIIFQKINKLFGNISEIGIPNKIQQKPKYFDIQDFYKIFTSNKDKFKVDIDDFINSLLIIKNNLENYNNSEISFNSSENELNNYLSIFIRNVTNKLNKRIENITKIIVKINKEIENNKEKGFPPYLYEDYRSTIEEIALYLKKSIEKYIKSQLNNGEIEYIYKIKDEMNKIINYNKINILDNSINGNEIMNYLFSNEEKSNILSHLNSIKDLLQNNTISMTNLSITSFGKKIVNDFNALANSILEKANSSNIMKEQLSEYNTLENYFLQIDNIEQNINELISFYAKNDSNNSFNQNIDLHEKINNATFVLQNKINNFGKKITNLLKEINKEKNRNLLEYHKDYFENNMLELYNITNIQNEFILNENSNYITSFDLDFILSVDFIIYDFATKIIDDNYDLAYEYLNEAINYFEDCCCLFLCSYYLSETFISKIKKMSKDSVLVYYKIYSDDFFNLIEEYYYSFEKEFQKYGLTINKTFINTNDEFSYLKNSNNFTHFNFTRVKEYIIYYTIEYVNIYANYKYRAFLNDANSFTNDKDGILYDNNDIDIKLPYLFSTYTCETRNNDEKLELSIDIIINHLKDEKENLTNKYVNKIKDIQIFYKNYYNNLENGLKNHSEENKYQIELYILLNNYISEIKNNLESFTNNDFLCKLINEYRNSLSNLYSNKILNKIDNLTIPIKNIAQIYNNTLYLNNAEEIRAIIFGNINVLKNSIKEINDYSERLFKSMIHQLIDNKIRACVTVNKNLLNNLLLDSNYDEYFENEILQIKKAQKEAEELLYKYEGILTANIDNISNSTNLTNNPNLINIYNSLDNIEKLSNSYLSFNESNYNKTNASAINFLNEIKIKRQIERIKKIVFNNDYSFDYDKNSIPEINLNNYKLFYENIKFNISLESERIIDKYIISEQSEIFSNYSQTILDKIEALSKDENEYFEIVNQFEKLIPKFNGNFIEEVKKDLNILYIELFDLIGKKIKYENKDINVENEKMKYFNKIMLYLNITLNNTKIDNKKNITLFNDEKLKNILFISIKRIKEKKINIIKQELNKIYEKYENLKNESNYESRISKIYNKIKKEELYSSYLNIYKGVINKTFKSPDLNKTKTSIQDIKKMTIDLYEENFNNFKEKFVKEENNENKSNIELINMIEKEIDSILKKIKNIIEISLKESQDIALDGYYMKRYIINICETQINLTSKIKNFTYDFINNDNNKLILEYIKKKEEDIYTKKMTDVLLENFRLSINDYYYNNYEYDIVEYLCVSHYYFVRIFIYTDIFIKNKLDYIMTLIKENTTKKYGNSTYEDIINLPDSLRDKIIKKMILNDEMLYSDIAFMKNKYNLVKNYLNIIFNDEFMKVLNLPKNYKNSFEYNDTIFSILVNYTDVIKRVSKQHLDFLYYSYRIEYMYSDELWYGEIVSITKNITNLFVNSPLPLKGNKTSENNSEYDFTNFYELIKELKYQNQAIDILDKLSLNEGIINSIIKEKRNIFKVNGIDKIVNKYQNFSNNINNKLKKISQQILDELKLETNEYNSIIEDIKTTTNLIKNYGISYLEEIKNYFDKLQFFAFIDGLNFIPIDKADQFRNLLNSSEKNNLRHLEHNNERKFLNKNLRKKIKKHVKDKEKKNILNKMEKLFENTTIRNLEEYYSNDLFNSTCEPLSYINISVMLENLTNEINNLSVNIKDAYNNKFKSIFDLLKANSDDFNNLIKLNQKLFESQLSLIFQFSPFTSFDFVENIVNYQINNRSDETLQKALEELINPINNNYFENLIEISSEMILSTYITYSDIINNQSKVITAEDIKINEYFINNIDNIDIIFGIIHDYKIFKKLREKVQTIKDLFHTESNSKLEFFKYESEYSGGIENTKTGESSYFKFREGKLIIAFKKCWSLDIIQKFLNETSPLKFVAPSFPFLQLRVWPTVVLEACISGEYESDDELMSSNLIFDSNLGAIISLNIEGGLYFDLSIGKKKKINFADLKAVVGVQGIIFDGKIGMKLKINLVKARIILSIYLDISAISFRFYFKISYSLLFLKGTLIEDSVTLHGIKDYKSRDLIFDLYKAIYDDYAIEEYFD